MTLGTYLYLCFYTSLLYALLTSPTVKNAKEMLLFTKPNFSIGYMLKIDNIKQLSSSNPIEIQNNLRPSDALSLRLMKSHCVSTPSRS